MNAGRHLGAERVPDDRGARPRWGHAVPDPGEYGAFVVDRMTDDEMSRLRRGDYFGARVDYRRNFPDLPAITRVFERLPDGRLRLWMTDGPQEVSMMTALARGHRGRVLVTGLGMGIVQQHLLARPEVTEVTTLETHPDVAALHEAAQWFADARHEILLGDAGPLLPELVRSGNYDGYVLDHWDTVGDRLEEKVSFLRLLHDAGQPHAPVSLWGFWWEVERTMESDDADTAALLAQVERCGSCARILARAGDPNGTFQVPGGDAGRCADCDALSHSVALDVPLGVDLPTTWLTADSKA